MQLSWKYNITTNIFSIIFIGSSWPYSIIPFIYLFWQDQDFQNKNNIVLILVIKVKNIIFPSVYRTLFFAFNNGWCWWSECYNLLFTFTLFLSPSACQLRVVSLFTFSNLKKSMMMQDRCFSTSNLLRCYVLNAHNSLLMLRRN